MVDGSFWLFICTVACWIKQAAFRFAFSSLDLDTVSADLDTIIEATTRGVSGDSITVAGVGDNDAEATAELDLGGEGSGALDTIVEAAAPGAEGNTITIELVGDSAGAGGVTIDEVGDAVTIHFEDGVSTVGDVETAIGTATLIAVKTAGTGATILAAATDELPATPLAGGLDSEGVTIVEDVAAQTVVIHWADGESTVEDVEEAITADATLISVKTAGTGATVLGSDDDFAATALDGGDAEDAELATAADGSMYVPAGVFVTLDGTVGARLSVIRASGDGTASLTRAKAS